MVTGAYYKHEPASSLTAQTPSSISPAVAVPPRTGEPQSLSGRVSPPLNTSELEKFCESEGLNFASRESYKLLAQAAAKQAPLATFQELIRLGVQPCNGYWVSNTLNNVVISGVSDEVIVALIDAGAKPYNVGREDNILTIVMQRGMSCEVIEALIDAGAKPFHDVRCDLQSTLRVAIEHNYPRKMLLLLLINGSKSTDYIKWLAEKKDYSKSVVELLKFISTSSLSGGSDLVRFLTISSTRDLTNLVAADLSPLYQLHLRDRESAADKQWFDEAYDPLSYAVRFNRRVEIVRALTAINGIKPNNGNKYNTLSYAVRASCPLGVIEALIEAKAKPCNDNEHNTLAYAIKAMCSVEVMKALVGAGAKIYDRKQLNGLIAILSDSPALENYLAELDNAIILSDTQTPPFISPAVMVPLQAEGPQILSGRVSPPLNTSELEKFCRSQDLDFTNTGYDDLFHQATAKKAPFTTFQKLIRLGVQPCNDPGDLNTLTTVVGWGLPYEVVVALINAGAKPGIDTLISAVSNKASYEVIEALIDAGAKPLEGEDGVKNILINAICGREPVKVIKALVGTGVKPCNADTEYNTLSLAVQFQASNEIISTLVNAGAKPCNADTEHNTLSLAVQFQASNEIISTLVNAGAKPCHADTEHNTLSRAVQFQASNEIISTLVNAGAKPCHAEGEDNILTVMMQRKVSCEVIEALIDAGAKPYHDRYYDQYSTLKIALEHKYTHKVILLLLNAGSWSTDEIASLAKEKGYPKFIVELLEFTSTSYVLGDFDLVHALKKNQAVPGKNLEAIDLYGLYHFSLRKNAADKQKLDEKHNPLSCAARYNRRVDNVKALAAINGIKPNNGNKYNTLSYAVRASCPLGVIEALIEAKAKPCNDKQHNTLAYAIKAQCSVEAMKALIEAGAKIYDRKQLYRSIATLSDPLELIDYLASLEFEPGI